MSPETISSLAAILLSLAFSYIPGLASRYETLDGAYKRLVMLSSLVLICVTVAALACTTVVPNRNLAADLGLNLTCTKSSLLTLVNSLILALVANQSTYLITPKKDSPVVPNSHLPESGEGPGVRA